MSIHVTCPDCNKTYKVDEKHEGKKIRCKDCSAIIEVYSTPMSPEDSEDYSPQERGRQRKPRRFYEDDDTYHSSAPKNSTSAVMGVLAIILGAIGLVLSFIPCIGFIGLPAAGLGLILGIIGFFMPDAARSSGRNLSIVGICLSLLAFVIVGVIMLVLNRAAKDMAKKAEEQAAKAREEHEKLFKEHQNQFNQQAEKMQADAHAEFKEQVEKSRAKQGAAVIQGALTRYLIQHKSEPPKSIEDLLPFVPFKDPKRLLDPWGNRYQIGEKDGPGSKKDYYIFTIHPTTKEEIRSDR